MNHYGFCRALAPLCPGVPTYVGNNGLRLTLSRGHAGPGNSASLDLPLLQGGAFTGDLKAKGTTFTSLPLKPVIGDMTSVHNNTPPTKRWVGGENESNIKGPTLENSWGLSCPNGISS